MHSILIDNNKKSTNTGKRRYLPSIKLLRLGFGISSRVSPSLATKIMLRHFYKPGAFGTRNNNHLKSETPVNIKTYEFTNYSIHTKTYGQGPSLLLLHGWGGSSNSFVQFIDPLVAAGFQVITVDLPAHGLSSGKESSLFDFIASTTLVLEKIPPIYAIIGHSLGGLAAMNIASRNEKITKVITISAASSINTIVNTYKENLNLSTKVVDKLFTDIERKFNVKIDDYSIDKLYDFLPQSGLLIHDEFDYVIPFSEISIIKQRWPNANMFTTKGLGHHRILKDFQVILEILKYLKE
jgi:predicted alpha/beta-fold hydrolase